MKVALLVALTVAAASATHWEYPKGYLNEFRGEPFPYGYGMKPYYDQRFGYKVIPYDRAIFPEMYAFEVPEHILRSYLPENIYKHYVPVTTRSITSPFVPEHVLKSYLPEHLYQFYVPHVQVPTPILKSYLPEPIFRNYIPLNGQIHKPFYQVPEPVVKAYLPEDIYRSYIPTHIQAEEGKGHPIEQGVFKSHFPATATIEEHMNLGGGYKGIGLEGIHQWRSMLDSLQGHHLQGHQIHGGFEQDMGNGFEFGLPVVETPIVQIPINQ